MASSESVGVLPRPPDDSHCLPGQVRWDSVKDLNRSLIVKVIEKEFWTEKDQKTLEDAMVYDL